MRIVNPGHFIMSGVYKEDAIKHIEACARTCYKSEKNIKDDSAEKLVSALIKRGHEAMLEHASFIFEVSEEFYCATLSAVIVLKQAGELVSFLRFTNDSKPIISGNVRAWRDYFRAITSVDNSLPDTVEMFIKSNPILFPEFQDSKFEAWDGTTMVMLKVTDLQTENEKLTHWDVTVKFICDRGVSHELVRHRVASFAQESTRYCNYGKDDFGSEITVIKPLFLEEGTEAYHMWKYACETAEGVYFDMLNWGCTPQEARAVLPNSLKTEIVVTMNLRGWRHFFKLRVLGTTGKPHPQMKEVAEPVLRDFILALPEVFDDLEVK